MAEVKLGGEYNPLTESASGNYAEKTSWIDYGFILVLVGIIAVVIWYIWKSGLGSLTSAASAAGTAAGAAASAGSSLVSGAANLLNTGATDAENAAGGLFGGLAAAANTAGNAIITGGANLSQGIINTANAAYTDAGNVVGSMEQTNGGGDGGILDSITAMSIMDPATAPISIAAGIVGTVTPGVLATSATDVYQFGDNLYSQVQGVISSDSQALLGEGANLFDGLDW
jgi:hypothetical protein